MVFPESPVSVVGELAGLMICPVPKVKPTGPYSRMLLEAVPCQVMVAVLLVTFDAVS